MYPFSQQLVFGMSIRRDFKRQFAQSSILYSMNARLSNYFFTTMGKIIQFEYHTNYNINFNNLGQNSIETEC